MTNIAIVNRSQALKDDAVAEMVKALQIQVDRDFVPVWGAGARLTFVASQAKLPRDAWWLLVLDNSDVADALGYHDVTPAGMPLGKAFAKTDIDSGLQPSVTLSHELLEMLVDPDINLSAQVANRIYAYEVCDPCEADAHAYPIGNVLVSDFVTPNWFQPVATPSGPFDLREKIAAPLELLSGGYLQFLELGSGAGWQQVTAAKECLAKQRPHVGSRRERRRVGRGTWQRSTAES